MDLKQLQAMGAIVPKTLFERTVNVKYRPLKPEADWAEPGNPELEDEQVEATMQAFIRKTSAAIAAELVQADDYHRPFVAIHRCVCNPDGTELFESAESAQQLQFWMALPLWEAIQSVNPNVAKKSLPRTSSGASSPSPSADEALTNGSMP